MNKTLLKKINEIKENYPSLKVWSDEASLSLYNSIQEHQLINEFITKTIDRGKTIKEFNKRFQNIRIFLKDKNKVEIEITNSNKSELDKIEKFMDSFGWYPSWSTLQKGIHVGHKYNRREIENANILVYVDVTFEPKYDFKLEIEQNFIYHVTPDILWVHIQSYGLTPKTKAKITNHPERIYFVLENDENIKTLIINLFNKLSEKSKSLIKKYYILKIDISKLKDKINFYEDPNYIEKGVWAYQNVPPKYIEIEDEVLVNHEIMEEL